MGADFWTGLFSGIGNSVNGGMQVGANLYGTVQANKYNRDIARETNEQNYKIWQEQQQLAKDMYAQEVSDNRADATTAYNRELEMWKMEQAYNDPSKQRQRLEDAGLNAGNIMGNGVEGNSTSTPGNAPQSRGAQYNLPSAPTMQGYDYNSPILAAAHGLNDALTGFGHFADSFATLATVPKTHAETKNLGLQFELQNTFGRQLLGYDTEIRGEEARWRKHQLAQDWNLGEDQRDINKATLAVLELDKQTKSVLNTYLDPYQQIGLIEQLQRIENMRKTGLLTDKQIDSLEQSIRESQSRVYLNSLNAKGVALDNTLKGGQIALFNKTFNSLVNKIRWDATLSGLEVADKQTAMKYMDDFYKLRNDGMRWDVKLKSQQKHWYPYQQLWNGFLEGGNTSARIYQAVSPFM